MNNLQRNTQHNLYTQPVHGALDYAELARAGLNPDEIIDFSVNSNPYGPSPRVREALSRAVIERYPDRSCLDLRQAILEYELAESGLESSALVCGNGASELIWTIARTYLHAGERSAIIGPTFGEYRTASQAVGAEIVEWRTDVATNFQPDVAALCTWIEQVRPALVWLCNPNNPTGVDVTRRDMLLIAGTCARCNALLIVDESYHHFIVPAATGSALELLRTAYASQILVLRSLTKDFALAALRVGYAVAIPEKIEQLTAQLPAWNVNGLAQVAASVALADREHLTITLARLESERSEFFHALDQLGLQRVASPTQFCLLRVGDGHAVRERLLQRRLLVRDCHSFGLPEYIRLSTRRADEWPQLVAALQEMV